MQCKYKLSGSSHIYRTDVDLLPEKAIVIGDLYGVAVDSLPKGLSVDGNLYLHSLANESLPEELTVTGSLLLHHIPIKTLPKGLIVGDHLYLNSSVLRMSVESLSGDFKIGKKIILVNNESEKSIKPKRQNRLNDGEYIEGKCLYADTILTLVKKTKTIGDYTVYIGAGKGVNVVSDGTYYTHCITIKEGIEDIIFKQNEDRAIQQYKNVTLDTLLSREDAINMYRVITGACREGLDEFINKLKEIKGQYSVREIIDISKGEYGNKTFTRFVLKEE